MSFAVNRLACFGKVRCNGGDRLAQLRAAVDLSFEPNTAWQHQILGAARHMSHVNTNSNGNSK